ncbi:DUF1328 family protein [Nitrosomonas sp.]|uniref:DUF1328 family protein n=1 Tax=Nitrosomonas sp. TaxID=42353 RepID=UPI0025FA7D4E|nr:DUF1328 family protein [Nitrosomonas sp.]MCC6915775.1 DUF1328 domain-containing protein [Nitrosomonas sp.]
MFSRALVFFLIAVLAGIPGFAGIAGTLAWAVKVLSFTGLILTVVFYLPGKRTLPV